MQQYRVNFALLIGLIVSLPITSVAVYGIWSFQIDRNAATLIEAAEKAEAEGDLRTAASEYGNYLSIRPGDVAIRVKMAIVWADVAEQDNVAPEVRQQAVVVLEETMRNLPHETELRRRLIDLYDRANRIQQAMYHLSIMLESDSDNPELLVLRSQFLAREGKAVEAIEESFKLVGYDEDSESFDVTKAIAPHDLKVYTTLAVLVRNENDDLQLADRVMNQLIEANPDSSEAYLQRGRYFISTNETDRGQRDIEKAYRIAPDDSNVLLHIGDRAKTNEQYDQARDYLTRGKEKYPEESRFYQVLADLELLQKNNDAALAVIEEGMKAVPPGEAKLMLLNKAVLQIRISDFDGIGDTVDQIRAAGFSDAYVEYIETQVLVSQGKWFEALRGLRVLPAKFSHNPDLTTRINYLIGLCNERLGLREKALDAYNLVLQQNPMNEPAAFGRQRILLAIGRPDDDSRNQQLQNLVNKELAKPERERNWAPIDDLATEFADRMNYEGAALDMFWARRMLARKDFDRARQYLIDANRKDPDNLTVRRLAVQVVRFDPKRGPTKAMQLLDQIVSHPQFGDMVVLRLDRADLILALDLEVEEKRSRLVELGTESSDWTDEEKAHFWDGLAARYRALGSRDKAIDLWSRVADLRPNDLPTRVRLFDLALETNDDAGMQAAQNKILEIVKSKNHSTWMYTEARRLMSLYRLGQVDEEALADVDQLIEEAFELRPDWFELHMVKAEFDLITGDEEAAIEHLQIAESLGKANPQAILQHVRLLLKRGQYTPARELIEQLPESTREGQLAQVYAEILLNTQSVEEAAEVARKYVELAEDNAARQLWFGRLLARGAGFTRLSAEQKTAFLSQSGEAFQKSIELDPTSKEAWMALIAIHAAREDKEKAHDVFQQAQLALPEDQLIDVQVRSFEILGRPFDAENVYVTVYKANPDNIAISRQLAAFYLGPYYRRRDMEQKAAPLVNQILRAAADGKLDSTNDTVMWARRTGAKLLAATKQYQQLLNAEKLLRSNSQNGKLSIEDQLRMAEILAPRPEPESRFKALNLLEQVAQQQRLSFKGEMTLAKLYFDTGQWGESRRQIRETVSRYPKVAEARITYIDMILKHGEDRYYDEASDQLKKLVEITGMNTQAISLMVRLASKTGEQQGTRASLLRRVPRVTDPKEITAEQLALMRFVATLLVELDDLDNAEKIFRLIVARDPRQTVALANFVGKYRDVAQSMAMLDELYRPELAVPIARVAVDIVRVRRDDVGETYDEQIEKWISRALRENPDSIPLKMLLAEFDDLRKHYDAAAEAYQELLKREELTGITRAIVLNNLAFLLVLSDSSGDVGLDPLKLVQEAAQILGPTTDILDTRAVVYLSRGEHQKAIDDLAYSVTDNPSSAKYFHKAQAHLGAGENTAAIEAWDKAEELGDIRSDLNRLEYERFEEVIRRIEELRDQRRRLTDAEPYRAAG